jgi:hypothetical protein
MNVVMRSPDRIRCAETGTANDSAARIPKKTVRLRLVRCKSLLSVQEVRLEGKLLLTTRCVVGGPQVLKFVTGRYML